MKGKYGKVNDEIIQKINDIVGSRNVFTDKDEIEDYSFDETPFVQPYFPHVVVKPSNIQSISKLLALANNERIPVTPRGAGTGLSGGCVPIYGGVVLSLERINRILEVDKDNFVAVVEPGLILSDLRGEVEKQGLYYPLYPGEMTATIGGNVATNAGGMSAVRYGVTRHHILGLEAALPSGEVIKTGGKFVKCSTGYDLTQLISGSEGTLAVVTKIIVKLTTKLVRREVLFVPFVNLQSAINAVPDILRLDMVPIGLEFMEKSIIDIVEKYLGREMPYHQYDAFLMIIMEGESDNDILEYFSKVEEICRKFGAVEAMLPGSERAKRRLIEAREKFGYAIKSFAPTEIIDMVVPRSEIARFVERVKEISRKNNIPVIVFGHAGDGNVHLHPICVDMRVEEWRKKLPDVIGDIYHAGVSFGGAISGEHGIGYIKKAYVPLQMDPALLNIMKSVKTAFDPKNILNPGKIFDL
jgi:glycolate oxidase